MKPLRRSDGKMYYSGWLGLITISLGVSLIAFVWALRNGQFSDQGRARYIPLSSEPTLPPLHEPAKRAWELYALIIVGLIGLASISTSIALSLYWM